MITEQLSSYDKTSLNMKIKHIKCIFYMTSAIFFSSEQLFAKELSVRGSAAAALKALAKQCSDPGAVEKLTAHLFTVLAGK